MPSHMPAILEASSDCAEDEGGAAAAEASSVSDCPAHLHCQPAPLLACPQPLSTPSLPLCEAPTPHRAVCMPTEIKA